SGAGNHRRVADRSVPVPEGLRAFRVTGRGGTIVLLAATVAGLAWANLPFGDSYEAFWEADLAVRLGRRGASLILRNWVNDGLVTLFFFTVGLEISRPLGVG